eukprot:scaffold11584_cov160-Amphora_coffeaeformis.AAC.6
MQLLRSHLQQDRRVRRLNRLRRCAEKYGAATSPTTFGRVLSSRDDLDSGILLGRDESSHSVRSHAFKVVL